MSNKEHNSSNLTWFGRVPRRFFRYHIMTFAIYIGLGYLLVGILHSRIWMQSKQVETIFTNLNLNFGQSTPKLSLILFCLTGIIAIVIFYLLFRKVKKEGGNLELVFWGTCTSFILAWIPWLYASSVVNTVFLFLFAMMSVIGLGIAMRLNQYEQISMTGSQPDAWKMFVNSVKACAAIIAILLGAIATNVLLPWRDTSKEGPELLRYAFLCAYMIIGMLAFILMPLLARSLEKGPTENVDLEAPGPL